MDYLSQINKNICGDEFKIRDNSYFNLIYDFINIANGIEDDEDFLNGAMKVCALIKLFQPFSDGNHRTALIVFGDLITNRGFIFDYVGALNDMCNNKLNIPTIYTENDKVGSFNNWYKYISKPEMKL